MLKQILHKLHLILGLVSGIIVLIVSITGALYAFKDEVEGFTQTYKKVTPQQHEVILPSKAFEIGTYAMPEKTIHGIAYRTAEDAIEVIYYQSEPFYYGTAYLNPYSGEVIKTVDFLKTFFGFVRQGHATLWLPMKIGYVVVALGTIFFVILLITGIVLWWPHKKSSSKSFSFSKSDKPTIKRLEYHKVVGFYVSFFALLIALTGLSWLIKGLDTAMYKSMGGDKDISWNPPLSTNTPNKSMQYELEPIDVVFKEIKKQYPNMPFIEVHIPDTDSASILVELNRDPTSNRKMDYLYFDQYTLKQIHTNSFYGSYDDADTADKIKRSYYGIHSGGILGLPGKILAFFVSLFCASLPVTGFILWSKQRKEKKEFLNKIDL
jgi:uncharacterized iron-regulated membrane protein